ncbi:MAG: hypothetical protein KDD22_02920 [Bdellovibrionales bacterium]|nr:hypothetical protein [Bdellovibrionales bacterium]
MQTVIKSVLFVGALIYTNPSLACSGIPYEPQNPSIGWTVEDIQKYEGAKLICHGSENLFEIKIVRERCLGNNLRVFLKEENTSLSYPVFYAFDMLAEYTGFMVQDPETSKTVKATCRFL